MFKHSGSIILLIFAWWCLAMPVAEASPMVLAEGLDSLAVTEIYQEDRVHLGYWPAGVDTSALKMFKAGDSLIYTGLFSLVASAADIAILQERLQQKYGGEVELLPLKAQTFSYRIEHKGIEIAARPLAGGSWRDMPLSLVFKGTGAEKELIVDLFIRFDWQDQVGWKSGSHHTGSREESPGKIEVTNVSGKFKASATGLRTVEIKRSLQLKISQ